MRSVWSIVLTSTSAGFTPGAATMTRREESPDSDCSRLTEDMSRRRGWDAAPFLSQGRTAALAAQAFIFEKALRMPPQCSAEVFDGVEHLDCSRDSSSSGQQTDDVSMHISTSGSIVMEKWKMVASAMSARRATMGPRTKAARKRAMGLIAQGDVRRCIGMAHMDGAPKCIGCMGMA